MPSEEEMVRLPAIDLCDPEEVIVSQVIEMMTTVGFLQLKNIEGYDESRLLADIKEFHNIPEEEKKKLYTNHYNPANKNLYHGMTPFLDNDPSHKELFDMGVPYEEADEIERTKILVEETPMPQGPQYASLVARYRAHETFSRRLSMKMAEYLAMGLGKDRHYFRDWFEVAPLSTFRTIRYLPRDQSGEQSSSLDTEARKLTTPPHCDSGLITLLSTFGYPGLQVLIDGEYRFVKPLPNHIVVNLGLTFERITNFTLKATKHQVVDIGVERYSCPFFMDPRSSAKIPSNIIGTAAEQVEPPVEYGKWLARSMKRFGEWKNAFPDLSDEEDSTNQSGRQEQQEV